MDCMGDREMGRVKISRFVQRRAAFTLIEVLVVVAIIALLVSILLPSLSRAREQAKRTVCLTHMKQQGYGFAGYASSNRGVFRFSLMEQTNYSRQVLTPEYAGTNQVCWMGMNGGALFPKFVGKTGDVFYCPSNVKIPKDDPDNGLKVLWQRYNHPRATFPNGSPDPEYVNAHGFPDAPKGAYVYAAPAAVGRFPRDTGPRMYPDEVTMTEFPGYPTSGAPMPPAVEGCYAKYRAGAGAIDPAFLGPWPNSRRGRMPWPALLSDAYFSEYWARGYHLGGYNVMFCDLHARWIGDPGGRINAANLPDPTYDYGNDSNGKAKGFQVWEYFSQKP